MIKYLFFFLCLYNSPILGKNYSVYYDFKDNDSLVVQILISSIDGYGKHYQLMLSQNEKVSNFNSPYAIGMSSVVELGSLLQSSLAKSAPNNFNNFGAEYVFHKKGDCYLSIYGEHLSKDEALCLTKSQVEWLVSVLESSLEEIKRVESIIETKILKQPKSMGSE